MSLISSEFDTGSDGQSNGQQSKFQSFKRLVWSTPRRQWICISIGWAIALIIVAAIVYASSDRQSSSSSDSIPGGVPASPWVADFQAYYGSPATTPQTPPYNLTIGFIADTALTEDTQELYNILKQDGIELLVVSGDLDYINNPEGWDGLLTSTLGSSFPVITAAGNHDYAIWPRYQQKEIDRWQRADIKQCHGYPGVAHVCTWKGVTIVQIAPGVFNETGGIYKNLDGVGNFDFVTYIRESFAKYPNAFKVCSWHKNQHDLQTGVKKDETGYGVYDECMKQGAMVMTGHEHSYERTYLLSDFQSRTIIDMDASNMRIVPARAGFVIVQGLGGRGIRPNYHPGPHWAVTVNSNTTATAGFSATVCKYNVNGQNNQAYCYTKDTRRRIQDEFFVTLPA